MTDQNARQLLVDWANEQQHWVRSIVRNVLATCSMLAEAEIVEAFNACLAERGLSSDTIVEVPDLIIDTGGSEGIERLQLTCFSEVERVNRLAPHQEITFNDRLTILFGENATGKSGYVRVLKRLAAVRSAETILPDIRTTSAGDPAATIRYRLGDTEQTLNWKGESGVPPFTRLGIFDTRAIALHLDEELTYVYTPRDLALFQYVHQAIQGVGEKLARRRDELRPNSNPFLRQFRVGSSIYPKIETLSSATDLIELGQLSKVGQEEIDSLSGLRELVEALRPGTIASRLQLARYDLEMYISLAVIAKTTAEFDAVGYASAQPLVVEAQQKHQDATVTAFEHYDIPGAFTETWQRFIAAAEDHLESIGKPDYPDSHDQCIYCQQELNHAAVELVALYRELARGSSKMALDSAQADLQSITARISTLNVEQIHATLTSKASASSEAQTDELIGPAVAFLESLQRVSAAVSSGNSIPDEIALKDAANFRDRVDHAVRGGTELVASLEKQGEERERESSVQTSKLRDLEDRLLLRELLPQISTHVQNARWGERANVIHRDRFPPLLRSLTIQAKMASETLLNEDFERLFNEECTALRAPAVTLQFPGRRGEAARRKSLIPISSDEVIKTLDVF